MAGIDGNASVLDGITAEVPTVTLDDVAGLNNVKDTIMHMIQSSVENQEQYAKFGMIPSKGVLLYRPPGCGKTMVTKAIANALKAKLISLKGQELLSGQPEERTRQIFDKARAEAPCILYFGNLDAIIQQRRGAAGHHGGDADRVINQFLSEMDGGLCPDGKHVFTFASTTNPNSIDPSMIRPGRLGQLIYVPMPDEISRLQILKNCTQSIVAKGVDFASLVKGTAGFTGSDLKQLCDKAIELSTNATKTDSTKQKTAAEITNAHLQAALKSTRRSVSDDDIKKFETIAKQHQGMGRGDGAFEFNY